MLKKIINKALLKFGYKINRTYTYHRDDEMYDTILNLKKLQLINPKTIIDVGAASGSWSLTVNEIFPDSNYVLFEPLLERHMELSKLADSKANFHFISKAAGEKSAFSNFHVSEDLDGSGFKDSNETSTNFRKVEITRLDDEILNLNLAPPFAIKLDTHGYEVPILNGCEKILDNVELFIIECYGFYLTSDSLLLWQMCEKMDQLGYRLVNIVDDYNRLKDNAFWQCDAFFIKKNSVIFEDNHYN